MGGYFAELSSDGTTLLYGTYLGGFETSPRFYPPLTIGEGITNLRPAPSMSAAPPGPPFPVTDGGLRNGMGGQGDAFIVAFASSAMSITTPSLLPAAPLQLPLQREIGSRGRHCALHLVASGIRDAGRDHALFRRCAVWNRRKSTNGSHGLPIHRQSHRCGGQGKLQEPDPQCDVSRCLRVQRRYLPGYVGAKSSALVSSTAARARRATQEYFTITGQLPPGVSVSSTGAVAGAATQIGEYGTRVRALPPMQSATPAACIRDIVVVADASRPSATLTVTPVACGRTVFYFELEFRLDDRMPCRRRRCRRQQLVWHASSFRQCRLHSEPGGIVRLLN